MTNTDSRCDRCPALETFTVGSALVCVSSFPELRASPGEPVGRRNKFPPVSVAAADTNSCVGCDATTSDGYFCAACAGIDPLVAELEAAWLLQPGVSELRIAKNGSAPSLVSPGALLTAGASAPAFSFPDDGAGDIRRFLPSSMKETALRSRALNSIDANFTHVPSSSSTT